MIDYEQLPFRCHRYHKYGHIAREYPIGFIRRRRQRCEVGMSEIHLEKEKGKDHPEEKGDGKEEDKMQMEVDESEDMQIEEILDQEQEVQGEMACAEIMEGEEVVSVIHLEGTILEPIPPFNSSLFSILNSFSRPSPSRLVNSENIHVYSVNEALDNIITSIPEIKLNHTSMSSLEIYSLSCVLI